MREHRSPDDEPDPDRTRQVRHPLPGAPPAPAAAAEPAAEVATGATPGRRRWRWVAAAAVAGIAGGAGAMGAMAAVLADGDTAPTAAEDEAAVASELDADLTDVKAVQTEADAADPVAATDTQVAAQPQDLDTPVDDGGVDTLVDDGGEDDRRRGPDPGRPAPPGNRPPAA